MPVHSSYLRGLEDAIRIVDTLDVPAQYVTNPPSPYKIRHLIREAIKARIAQIRQHADTEGED